MIVGNGIDIIELKRIEALVNKQNFIQRILTENEQTIFFSLSDKRKVEFLAGRFAAKEAYAKALGTGIGKTLSWQDIEITPNELGKPFVRTNQPTEIIHLSISHSKEYAVASVIIETI